MQQTCDDRKPADGGSAQLYVDRGEPRLPARGAISTDNPGCAPERNTWFLVNDRRKQ
jgi:hypothetical protein